MTLPAKIVAVFLGLTAWCGIGAIAFGQEPVTITLFPQAVVDDTLITLGQIARISGGPAYLQARLEKLDVAELKLGAAYVTVLVEQVRFRILLAGLETTQFRLGGAQRALVEESAAPAALRQILTAAERTLRANYPGDAAHATFTPSKGVSSPGVQLRAGERVHLEARLKGPLAPGADRALVEVAITVGGKTREVVPVSFAITEFEPAPVMAADKQAVRPAVFTMPASASREFFVKTGDNVKIIATIGSARIEAAGEATQNGRIGDIIRVRNVESNRTVHGRIDASGAILVDY